MPIVEIKDLRRALPPKARLMGIDHAEKKIGLALSNPELTVVTPFKTLSGKNFTENLKTLSALCREYGVGGFIIGLPLNMDGTTGSRAQSVRTFASNLMKAKEQLGFDPVIVFFDERLSTFAASETLQDIPASKRKDALDAQAAAQILNDALKNI